MVSIAVKTFGVCGFSRLAVMDWRLWFLTLMRQLPLPSSLKQFREYVRGKFFTVKVRAQMMASSFCEAVFRSV